MNAGCLKNKKWLDIGCGKGGSIRNINHFSPSNYLGIDNDPYCVWECKERYGLDSNYHNFILYDFNKNHEDYNNLTDVTTVNCIFDYIVCNFSIHFSAINQRCLYKWIEEINQKSKKNSLLFINFMNYDKLQKYFVDGQMNFNDNKSYIKNIDSTTLNDDLNQKWVEIYFDWSHNKPTIEAMIGQDRFISDWSRYGWDVIKIYSKDDSTCDINKFSSLYTWLVLRKK